MIRSAGVSKTASVTITSLPLNSDGADSLGFQVAGDQQRREAFHQRRMLHPPTAGGRSPSKQDADVQLNVDSVNRDTTPSSAEARRLLRKQFVTGPVDVKLRKLRKVRRTFVSFPIPVLQQTSPTTGR